MNACLDPMNGGNCEFPGLAKNATLLSVPLPDGKTCTDGSVVAPPTTEQSICLQTLGRIFSSGCAQDGEEGRCLCGTTDINACIGGTATPTGPLYDLFACDFNSTSGSTISGEFKAQTFGSGMANALVLCLGAFGCGCF
jgi:hypothetical protein